MQLAMPKSSATITVGHMNLWNFFDPVDNPSTYDPVIPVEEYASRLKKLALTITTTLGSPTILSLNEIENNRVLDDILRQPEIRALGYKGVIRPSNDGRGINVAVLYRGPLEVTSVHSINAKENFSTDPAKGQLDPSLLYSRPPLEVSFKYTGLSQALSGVSELTVIVNHFKSKLGGDGPEPRRQRQGEYLGEYLDKKMSESPSRGYIVVGDLNATYEDGAYKKLAYRKDGTERLHDVLSSVKDEDRYTYIYRGKKDLLDHIMVSSNLMKTYTGVSIPHINTIKGASKFKLDPTVVSGISDHDPAVATFYLFSPESTDK